MFIKQRYQIVSVLSVLIGLQVAIPGVAQSQKMKPEEDGIHQASKAIPPRANNTYKTITWSSTHLSYDKNPQPLGRQQTISRSTLPTISRAEPSDPSPYQPFNRTYSEAKETQETQETIAWNSARYSSNTNTNIEHDSAEIPPQEPIQPPTLSVAQNQSAAAEQPTTKSPAPLAAETYVMAAKSDISPPTQHIEAPSAEDSYQTIKWNQERITPDEPSLAEKQENTDANIQLAQLPPVTDTRPTTEILLATDSYQTIKWNQERIAPTIVAAASTNAPEPPQAILMEQAMLSPPSPTDQEDIDAQLPEAPQPLNAIKISDAPPTPDNEAQKTEATAPSEETVTVVEEIVEKFVPPVPIQAPQPDIAAKEKEPTANTRRAEKHDTSSSDTDPNAKKVPVKDVVAIALRTNPSLTRSMATKELYEASLEDLQGQQKPQISAFSNFSGEYDTSQESSSRFDDSLSAKAGIRMNYLLYNFGASSDRVAAGTQTVEQATLQHHEAQESLAFDVISTYLEVLRQKELLNIEQFRLSEHEDFLALIEKAAQADQVLKSQLYLAKTGLSQRKQSYLNAERQFKQTSYALERLVGEKLDTENFEKPFSPIVILPEEEEFIAMGVAASPEIQAIEKAVQAAQYQHDASRKDKYGSVNLSMNLAADRNLTAEERKNEASGSVLLEYSVPLYSGNSNDARIKQAAASLKQVQSDKRLTQDMLREQLRLAYYAIQQNEEILSLSKAEEQDAMKTLDAYKGEIAYGGRSFSDIIAQIDSVAAARGREISARTAKTLAAFAIIRRQSSLLDHLKIDRSQTAQN